MVHKRDGGKRPFPSQAGEPFREEEPQTAEQPARRELLDEGTRCLTAAGVRNARREAEWLLSETLRVSRAMLYARPRKAVPAEEARAFRARLQRRAGGEPLQYVLGHADFFGLRLTVTPSVLIPRPETEDVVAGALRRLHAVPDPTILDVGTGSGCIALALKAERPDAAVHACDVSRDALVVARANAEACGLNVQFFHADVLANSGVLPADLDLLISNPPYIPSDEAAALPVSVRAHEPGVALFSGDDPLRFYRLLTRQAPRLLAPGGQLVLETHADHASDVAALLGRSALEGVTVENDSFGQPRLVCGAMPRANGPSERESRSPD